MMGRDSATGAPGGKGSIPARRPSIPRPRATPESRPANLAPASGPGRTPHPRGGRLEVLLGEQLRDLQGVRGGALASVLQDEEQVEAAFCERSSRTRPTSTASSFAASIGTSGRCPRRERRRASTLRAPRRSPRRIGVELLARGDVHGHGLAVEDWDAHGGRGEAQGRVAEHAPRVVRDARLLVGRAVVPERAHLRDEVEGEPVRKRAAGSGSSWGRWWSFMRLALGFRDACAAGAGRGLVRRDHDALDARGGGGGAERQGEGRGRWPRWRRCRGPERRERARVQLGETSGTSASARNAGETSTTAQPSAQARGAHSRATSAPAQKIATSQPRNWRRPRAPRRAAPLPGARPPLAERPRRTAGAFRGAELIEASSAARPTSPVAPTRARVMGSLGTFGSPWVNATLTRPPEQVPERRLDGREAEPVAELERLARQHPLAREDGLGGLADREPHREPGAGRKLGRPSTVPMARASSDRHRLGRARHERPSDARPRARTARGRPRRRGGSTAARSRRFRAARPRRAGRGARASGARRRRARARCRCAGAPRGPAPRRVRRPPPSPGRPRRGSPVPAASPRRAARRRASRSSRRHCPTRARGPPARTIAAMRAVARTRLSWMRRFFGAVQRPSATGSPARLTHASQPASSASHAPGSAGSPGDHARPRRQPARRASAAGQRGHRVPRAEERDADAAADEPVAPVTKTFTPPTTGSAPRCSRRERAT